MRFLLLSALLASLSLFSTCEAWRWKFGGNAGARFGFQINGPGGIEGEEGEVGDSCEPAAARPCGEKTLVSGPEVEQLSEEEFGPNVCRYIFTFEVKKFKFELRRSSRCGFRALTNQCPLVCSCTGVCSEETMTIEKAVVDCCEGFTTPRPSPLEIASGAHAYSFFKTCKHRSRISSSGCSIRVCPDEGGTATPTAMPTTMPTTMPTATPTAMPTAMPTTMPTDMPTVEVVIPTNGEIEG